MKIQPCYSSWLLTSAWVLSLMASFLTTQLHAGAPPKPTTLKTPADASVTFELADADHPPSLCSGARFSHVEIATSQTCMEKLRTYIDSGSAVHAISSHGEDYGEIRLTDTNTKEEATADTVAPQLAIVMLAAPAEADVLWPAIHIGETSSNSAVTVHSRGEGEDELQKRSATSQAILGSCGGELCTVHNGSDTQHLNDGSPVFQDKHLLCISTEERHCLRTRTLTERQSSCPSLQHFACDNFRDGTCNAGVNNQGAKCMHNGLTCSVTINPSQETVICGSCTAVYNAGQVEYTSGGQTSSSPINDDCPRSSGTPWYATTGAIAGFAAGGFVLFCVVPCAACTLCICCGCSACCQSCAMCAKSKTTVNNKLQMQQMN